eukprot:UC4_evm1s1043
MSSSRPATFLQQEDLTGRTHAGFIQVKDKYFKIRIVFDLDAGPHLMDKANFECDMELRALLYGHEDSVLQRLRSSKDIFTFVTELEDILERVMGKNTSLLDAPEPKIYADLIEELDTLGWDKLDTMGNDFASFTLSAQDSAKRKHFFKIVLSNNYPEDPPLCIVDMPVPFEPIWPPKDKCIIRGLYNQFGKVLESLQDFWDVMDRLDSHAKILDPISNSRKEVTRRLSLGSNVSITVDVDPRRPNSLPNIRFLGPKSSVAIFRENLRSRCHIWDQSCNIIENIENTLLHKLPTKEEKCNVEDNIECSICYSYMLDDEVPEVICPQENCAVSFHRSCLLEYIRTMPDHRSSYQTVFGNCPYCDGQISLDDR